MDNTMIQPLNVFTSGQKGTIVSLTGGRTCHERLKSMGLHIGSDIEVIHCGHRGGPLMVAIGETRLAIGRGMAQKILAAVTTPERAHGFFSQKRCGKGWMRPFCRKARRV